MTICPCGTDKKFAECCQPLLEGELASSPEALMRSRYTAFVVKNMDYVRTTTDPQTVLTFDLEASREWAENSRFLKLEVLRATDEGNKGVVEFKAHFQPTGGEPQIHHELSKFRKQAGVWYFREGRMIAALIPKN